MEKLIKKKIRNSQVTETIVEKQEEEPVKTEETEPLESKEEIKETEPVESKKEINYIEVLFAGIHEIKNKLRKRKSFWNDNKKIISLNILMDYDGILNKRINEMITTGRNLINDSKNHLSVEIQSILRGILKAFEIFNDKTTVKIKKDIKLMGTMCYKFKNKTMNRIGRTHKEKKYVIKRINHKTTKRQVETKGMISLINKTDFNNKLKLWTIKFNIMKDKFKNKREVKKYSFEKAEDKFKNKLKREKRYAALKVVKHKRENPLKKRLVNHLIRKEKQNLMNQNKYKKIWLDHSKLIEMYRVVVLQKKSYGQGIFPEIFDPNYLLAAN